MVEAALCPEERKKFTDLRENGSNLAKQMDEAWELARDQVKRTQKRQTMYYDWKPRQPQSLTGNRVLLYKQDRRGRELERPYHAWS